MNSLKLSIGGIHLPGRVPLWLGARHPSSVGALALDLELDDEVITAAQLHPGYFHRGVEKLFEVRDYRSALQLADRHDWLSSFSGELVVSMTIEQAMGLSVPIRAVWLRTALTEIARISSHLSYLSYVADPDQAGRLWAIVDEFRDLALEWSGNRIHPMLNRLGGLASDIPAGWDSHVEQGLQHSITLARELLGTFDRARFTQVAPLTQGQCLGYGISGPAARATGLAMDTRPQYLAYGDLGIYETPIQQAGDAAARFVQLAEETLQSAELIRRCLAGLPGGPVAVKLARRVRVPEGEHWTTIEAPWGLAGVLLVSRGGQTPWRLALRTPTFANVSALSELLIGSDKAQIADIVASIGYAIGDLDK